MDQINEMYESVALTTKRNYSLNTPLSNRIVAIEQFATIRTYHVLFYVFICIKLFGLNICMSKNKCKFFLKKLLKSVDGVIDRCYIILCRQEMTASKEKRIKKMLTGFPENVNMKKSLMTRLSEL